MNNKNSQKLVDLIGFKTDWKLVFRASEDGFDPVKLRQSKSGGIRNTITIIKTSNSFIFGGFTSADWSPVNGLENTFKYDENAFLFSLVNDFNTSVRMNITQPSSPAIMTGVNSGLIFGKAESISIPYFLDIDSSDLHIDFIMTQGYSDIGKSYQLPAFLSDPKIRPDISKFFLAGSNIFYPVDIEVYSTVDRNFIFSLLLIFPHRFLFIFLLLSLKSVCSIHARTGEFVHKILLATTVAAPMIRMAKTVNLYV